MTIFISMFSVASPALLAVLLLMGCAWLLSVKCKDASLVDRFWGLNFILITSVYFLTSDSAFYWRQALAIVFVMVWGLRLSMHIHWRNRAREEDKRYQEMRHEHGKDFWWYSFFSVFLLQGILAWILSAPLAFIFHGEKISFSFLDLFGILIWCVGFYFEVLGDYQLKQFKSDPANKGKILNTGLWSLTRHPNYFGEALMSWSIFTLALPIPGAWQSVLAPVLMTFLLRYVSGVSLLEKDLKVSKPGYAEYISKTPAFFPKLRLVRIFSSKQKLP